METLKILAFVVGILIVLALCYLAYRWIQELILLKYTLPRLAKEDESWIPFEDLVNPNDSFNPCPNCGQKKIRTEVNGSAFTPSTSDLGCRNCDCYFILEEKDSRKGFKIVVS